MEHVLQVIEHIRRFPEPVRRQILWVTVVSTCCVLGVVWVVMLSLEFRVPQETQPPPQETGGGVPLPSAWESVQHGGAQLTGELRGFLRGVLLPNESGSGDTGAAAPQEPKAAPSPVNGEVVHLPNARN